MDLRASAFVFCAFVCAAWASAQEFSTDSVQYWQKDREWKVRNFGHGIGVEVGWYDPHDLATMQLFPRNGSVVDVTKDYARIYFLSVSLALHTEQDVSWSRIDNGTLGGHQWRFSLDRFPGRTSGMIAETDSIAGDSVYIMSTGYFYSQNECGVTLERRWRSNERRPFYFGGGFALGLGTTTSSQFYVYESLQLRDVSGTRMLTSNEEVYKGKRCSYVRASLTGRAGVRILKRMDVAIEAAYGMGLQMIHGSDVRVTNQRVAVCFSTRYTIKR